METYTGTLRISSGPCSPYHGTGSHEDNPLWRLHKLSNIAKHRAIPVHGTSRKLNLKAPPGVSLDISDDYTLVMRGPAERLRELEHVPISTVEVLFGEWPDGIQATADDLNTIYEHVVDDVVPRFVGFFPKA